MRLNSRMHSVPTLPLVGSRNDSPSGLILQNLVCATDSLVWSADVSFSSDSNSSVRSFQIVSKFFSPEMYMNLHSVEGNLVEKSPASMVD